MGAKAFRGKVYGEGYPWVWERYKYVKAIGVTRRYRFQSRGTYAITCTRDLGPRWVYKWWQSFTKLHKLDYKQTVNAWNLRLRPSIIFPHGQCFVGLFRNQKLTHCIMVLIIIVDAFLCPSLHVPSALPSKWNSHSYRQSIEIQQFDCAWNPAQ